MTIGQPGAAGVETGELNVDLLPADACVRAVAVNIDTPHALFIGAGASISSGVPSVTTCVWEWKRSLFLTQNPALASQFEDISSPAAQERVQRWLDSQGIYPELGSAAEYSKFAELCYPIAQDRRQYFYTLTQRAAPHLGYHMAALLAKAGVLRSVWTTNFDALFVRATSAAGQTVIEVGLDTTGRLDRPQRAGETVHVALHGDYRYDALKNTTAETQAQDKILRDSLVDAAKEQSFLVLGYSGRDESVMESLLRAFAAPGRGRLYWCLYGEETPNADVTHLVQMARRAGREAFLVSTIGFDDFLVRLAFACLRGSPLSEAQGIRARMAGAAETAPSPFGVADGPVVHLIKSNAFSLDSPPDVLELDLVHGTERPWALLRERSAGTPVCAVPDKDHVLAFGEPAEVRRVLNGLVVGDVRRTPLAPLERTRPPVRSLQRAALVQAMAKSASLASDGERLLWCTAPFAKELINGIPFDVFDAVLVSVRFYGGASYVVLKPTLTAQAPSGERPDRSILNEIKRRRLTRQYNKQFNEALNRWRTRLLPHGRQTFAFPSIDQPLFPFIVAGAPTFAALSGVGRQLAVPRTVQPHIAHRGLVLREPSLVFASRDGQRQVLDTHPIRGISDNRPFDHGVELQLGNGALRLGVVCPAADAAKVTEYLSALHQRIEPTSKQEYLLPFPGFASAFGVQLSVPDPRSDAWACPPETTASGSVFRDAAGLGRALAHTIEALVARTHVDVVVIVIPDRWEPCCRFETDDETFDLHDFLKAFCVQRGIGTQLLREQTLRKEHQCEVRWWLSLALYAKAMRTPWAMEALDPSTSFVGLGFSVRGHRRGEGHVVLGCSHIFNCRGLGLRYRLAPLGETIMRGRNPFMSREDARRMGELTRQVFLEQNREMPSRVVIHRRSPFRTEEREGLLEALHGVAAVEMLEVNLEPELRCVASRLVDGKFQGDSFPVERGSVVVLDSKNALLWTHGTVPALAATRRYYMGKSRIPAPLMLVRHHGNSSLATLATEILALSKMNWNTFDMYDRLPATLESASAIARVGVLLERYGGRTYDYRLFI